MEAIKNDDEDQGTQMNSRAEFVANAVPRVVVQQSRDNNSSRMFDQQQGEQQAADKEQTARDKRQSVPNQVDTPGGPSQMS